MKRIIIIAVVFLMPFVQTNVSAQTASDEASAEADVVRAKVREVVDNTVVNPKAYVGLITDIVESTLQIKNKFGEIEQVSVLDDAEIVSVGKTTSTIELADVAIGDFVIAMGFTNGNMVLEASRVVVTDEVAETTRKAFEGTVSDKNKNSFTLVASGNDISVNLTKSSLTTDDSSEDEGIDLDFTDVVDGDTVIVVGEFENGIVNGRRVHIVKSAPTEEVEAED